MSEQLIILYQQIAEHTEPVCASQCSQSTLKYRCCDKDYCEIAIRWTKIKYGIDLPITDNKELPLMGENGCIAAPHHRPICSIHCCSITSLGHKAKPEDWTKKYFEIRDEIEKLENLSEVYDLLWK